ncbi:TrbC/VirB2 family protein [Escherichia coli]|nr:conjugal transfer protein [Escherichia coli]MDL6333965.1 TrbC/VirB2 family protein [Escherichia coli]MDL6445281.1 TrbC/VirB2 family protein [Escherichia coli]MDL6450070.1 TrbC/VirB2 family protein [Escherichia coli]MDL6517755.1 TrbC/VirB2 family protein [Escherichia coli]
MKYISKNLAHFYTALCLFFVLSATANAADGFVKVNAMLNNIITGLHTVAIATATLAGLWVGFKVLFRGEALMDMKNVIIGAGIIIGIAEFVAMVIT